MNIHLTTYVLNYTRKSSLRMRMSDSDTGRNCETEQLIEITSRDSYVE